MTAEYIEEEANFEHPTRTDEHISFLHLPVIRPGKAYIYPLWKFLLSRWLSSENHEVYLATPFLDTKRLTDICNIVIENPDTANIGDFFVRRECLKYEGKDIKMIIEETKEKISDDKYSTSEQKIFKKILVQKSTKYFHAKFIACTYNETAKVLVTSANFSGSHFNIQNYESVVYHEMTKAEFTERFIEPMRLITEHDPSILH